MWATMRPNRLRQQGRNADPACTDTRSVILLPQRRETAAPGTSRNQPMRSKTLLLGSFIALLAVPAMAQGNNAINVIGTVDKMDATTISVKNNDGQMQTFKLAPNVLY